MPPSRETEIKLPVADADTFRRKLKKLGFKIVTGRRFESNRLFDFKDRHLRKEQCLLRLRFENDDCKVTFKGRPVYSHHFKIRHETETRVGDGESLRGIFKGLGLREVFRYDKYRTTFAARRDAGRRHPPLVELDETPIGTYAELEGPRRWITKTAGKLGYSPSDYITESYATLYFRRCKRLGVKPKDMVFKRRK